MVFALLGVLAMAAAGAPSMLACVSRASAATINSAMIFTVKLSPRGRARASVRADARIRTGARLLLVAQKGTAAAMACLATIRSNERWSCEASCTPECVSAVTVFVAHIGWSVTATAIQPFAFELRATAIMGMNDDSLIALHFFAQ